ncbi:MAG: hypothetical protein ABSG91_01415 [Syntrophobacteraceae bacterium]|jgi:hypothetical protein
MGNLFKSLLPVLIGCFVNGCLLAVAVLAGSETSSIITYSESSYNFGELSEMAPLSHDFIVKNGSGAILHIRDVQPS